jgi:protein-disulfide isomerase
MPQHVKAQGAACGRSHTDGGRLAIPGACGDRQRAPAPVTALESRRRVNYNAGVRDPQNLLRFLGLPMLAALALTSACKRETPGTSSNPAEVIAAADNASGTTDKSPLPGIDVAALDDKKQDLFYRLAGTLPSPCGKAHSLRTSVTTDTSCKRAPFAARYVVALLGDGAPESFVQKDFEERYKGEAPKPIDTAGAPMSGNDDAPIKLVEFFDYACPACQSLHPKLDQAVAEHQGQAVVYYRMFPLESKHPDSRSAAQAALAANAQGKFKEMHALLFARSPAHKREDVLGYAKQLGLDLAKFEADYAAASPRVDADFKQGEMLGVSSTPTLYFNGRKYTGPHEAKYISMWIEEEVAVNR